MPRGDLSENDDFKQFLKNNGQLLYTYSDYVLWTLPNPRVLYYQFTDYFTIQRGITKIANDLVNDLGFYPVKMDMDVLKSMQILAQGILFLGLVFDIVILLFVVLSILLIYSMLMISVESKTFEFGVMRMQGLSKSGIVGMILLQGMMFVLPSMFVAFVMAIQQLGGLNKVLFSPDMGIDLSPLPTQFAVISACIIGLVIPLLSSIAPI